MDKPVNFRRAKLVKFIAEQQRIVDETATQLQGMGHDGEGYREARETILERLRSEFKVGREEA